MRPSSLYALPSATDLEPNYPPAYDPIVEFLKTDLRRARWILQTHIPDPHGWCAHQGAHEQYRWPCQLFQCAQEAMIAASAPFTRPAPSLTKARKR